MLSKKGYQIVRVLCSAVFLCMVKLKGHKKWKCFITQNKIMSTVPEKILILNDKLLTMSVISIIVIFIFQFILRLRKWWFERDLRRLHGPSRIPSDPWPFPCDPWTFWYIWRGCWSVVLRFLNRGHFVSGARHRPVQKTALWINSPETYVSWWFR